MTLPTQTDIELPLLKVLADNNGQLPTSVAIEKVTAYFLEITPEDLASRLKSGANRWKNRVRWAKQSLIHNGELDNSVWAMWKITDKGKIRLEREWSSWRQGKIESMKTAVSEVISQLTPSRIDELAERAKLRIEINPEELLEASLTEITENLETEILDSLSKIAPSSFESVIGELLKKMGYGKVQVTGRSGDGGIDGTCSIDPLGLYKVHFQAKRWKNQVGVKDIRDFLGGIEAARVQNGIFVTTSDFTQDALDTAHKSGRVRLVDGKELAGLMIEHELGVTRKRLHLPSIDRDYFEGL